MKSPRYETVQLEKIVGGGQALGTLADGRKAFVWGGLPGETVVFRVTKKKSRLIEGVATEVITASKERIKPKDPSSYLSTSPWQIMSFNAEQHYKAALIEEAFELHDIVLPNPITVFTDNQQYQYRNKVEFSWYGSSPSGTGSAIGDTNTEKLDLAFFTRGGKGKIPVEGTSLAHPAINNLAQKIRDLLQSHGVTARQLKTLLVRCNQQGDRVWQLYVKDVTFDFITEADAGKLPAQGGEVIYSDPKSPASRITKRLHTFGNTVLTDTILGVPFRYATEGFFQVNLAAYEAALRDMQTFIPADKPVVGLYSGVGSIGLTIGGNSPELIEVNEDAVREMNRNITQLKSKAKAILAPSEKALDYITSKKTIIVDPPRAGLHNDIIQRLLEVEPNTIVYLSCNPVTQARDVALLATKYGTLHHQGYNFFPRTPHIENLVVLQKRLQP